MMWDDLAKRLADEPLGGHAEHRRQWLVDPDVPEVLVEERESGRGIQEEGVEHPAVGPGALGGAGQAVAHRARDNGGRHERPRAEDPGRGGLVGGLTGGEHRRPERHGDSDLCERMHAAEEERDVDDDADVEQRVPLPGRLRDRQQRDDQGCGEGEQAVDERRQPLVAGR